ncbi:hypothetical protein LZG74_16290 [Dyadobacter sp. CY327]|uniref:hypothetical protein n=1 Tax=Dyadobacter sp. CY327 TaxID=2907301 RepID=UPI001F37B977|nr:hypothetical protein [Dyadobacter sp. CY327]MCE7071880.1 hypothetical protein [Dyadobacter sp. CY327]
MGLLEWFLESGNPGPVGKVEINSPKPDDDNDKPPGKWIIYIVTIIGLFLAVSGLYWVFNNVPDEGFKHTLIKLCFLSLYVVVGHFVKPTPDHTNIGWLGGLVDNPFRISDDYNRWLLFAQIILLPARLIAYGLIMSWIIGRHFYRKDKFL